MLARDDASALSHVRIQCRGCFIPLRPPVGKLGPEQSVPEDGLEEVTVHVAIGGVAEGGHGRAQPLCQGMDQADVTGDL